MEHPFAEHIGLQVLEQRDGYSECELTLDPARHMNPHQVVHGAVLYALADTGMGAAVYPGLAPALRVVAKNPPLVVIRRSFGVTKLLFSFLDWRIFSRNRRNSISVNRPYLLSPSNGWHRALCNGNG
ncbi:PaaI family thioesterase [Spongiibacter marinus]|uniref:PaaI family thioesterase n=1 Tax=Spongiibacter marinus TaxID=354246 RepID=UPI0035647F66